jgi:hypothetical protein
MAGKHQKTGALPAASSARKFIHRRVQQIDLVAAGQLLDGRLPPAGTAATVPALEVDHLHRAAPAEIPGAPAVGMLSVTPGEVIGDPRVERGIRAANDIDLPVHRAMLSSLASHAHVSPSRRGCASIPFPI